MVSLAVLVDEEESYPLEVHYPIHHGIPRAAETAAVNCDAGPWRIVLGERSWGIGDPANLYVGSKELHNRHGLGERSWFSRILSTLRPGCVFQTLVANFEVKAFRFHTDQ
jgi:hypothetical protein